MAKVGYDFLLTIMDLRENCPYTDITGIRI